jgi:hypothetical protein
MSQAKPGAISIRGAIVRCEGLWHQGSSVLKRMLPNAQEREPLQLFLGALLYQRWALAGFAQEDFHRQVKENPAGGEMADLAARDPLNPFHHVGATMHLASASMRLPIAVSLVVDIRPATATEFDNLFAAGKSERWPRGRACRQLEAVRQLSHCSPGLTKPLAIVIVLLGRDEFGHGEDGEDSGGGQQHWRRDRLEVMTSLYCCRIVEAQQMLAEWAFGAL